MYFIINKLLYLFLFLSLANFSIFTEVNNKKYLIQEKHKKTRKNKLNNKKYKFKK